MTKNRLKVIAATIAFLLAARYSTAAVELSAGTPAPDFSLKSTAGNMVSLADFAKPTAVVVIFSCNHCPFSKAYENRIIDLYNDYHSKGVELVVINSNDVKKQPMDSYDEMVKRADEKKFPFPYVYDATQAVAKAYGATNTPHAYVFDGNKKLVYRGRIDDNTEVEKVKKRDVRDALDNLIAGTPDKIATPITKAFGCTIKWKE